MDGTAKTTNAILIKFFEEMNKQIEEQDELLQLVTSENVEYAAKINTMKTSMANVNHLIKNVPGSHLDILQNLHQVLQTCTEFQPTENTPTVKPTLEGSLPGEPENGNSSQEDNSLFNSENSSVSNFAGQQSTSDLESVEDTGSDTDEEELTP